MRDGVKQPSYVEWSCSCTLADENIYNGALKFRMKSGKGFSSLIMLFCTLKDIKIFIPYLHAI